MNCLPAMIGALIPARTHGQKLSILFARASSSAPALKGLAKRRFGSGFVGLLGSIDDGLPFGRGCSRDGERIGEEKERR